MLERRTSIENKTPPIGEPKATATPAALAAVIISRILPVQMFKRFIYQCHLTIKTHFDFEKIYQITLPQVNRYNKQRGLKVPPFLPKDLTQLPEAA